MLRSLDLDITPEPELGYSKIHSHPREFQSLPCQNLLYRVKIRKWRWRRAVNLFNGVRQLFIADTTFRRSFERTNSSLDV